MPETAPAPPATPKSPKTPRRLKTPGDTRVHFSSDSNNNNTGEKSESVKQLPNPQQKQESQPTHFPQIGAAPNGGANLQWHTSANPTLSINSVGGQPFTPGGFTPQQQVHPAFFNLSSPTPTPTPFTLNHNNYPSLPQPNPITYIGLHTQPPAQGQATMAADYQNCAPPANGVHFQPPVPDTTFGPIPHVYVPRFDGGLVPGFQVGHPPVQLISTPTCTATTTVVMPKTFYLNGYTYYASGFVDPSGLPSSFLSSLLYFPVGLPG